MVDLQVNGHRAIVTGSSAGIREAIARKLAAEDVAVIVHGRAGLRCTPPTSRPQSGTSRVSCRPGARQAGDGSATSTAPTCASTAATPPPCDWRRTHKPARRSARHALHIARPLRSAGQRGGPWHHDLRDRLGLGAPAGESAKQFELFAEAGGTLIDTANKYTNGTAESILGDLLATDRDHFVVGTKYSLNVRDGDLNAGGNHRKSLVQALEASLQRLRTDHVDILWLHAWDYLTPPEEVMRALDDQVRLGKVLYLGISDTPAWVAAQMQTLTADRGWSTFAGLQVEYSLVQREVERELIPMARGLGLGVLAWGPLGAGILSGKYANPDTPAAERRIADVDPGRLAIARAVADIADALGLSSSVVALAWLRAQGGVIPILGARTAQQLADNLMCLDVNLPPDALARLDQASHITRGFPHDFLASADFILGGMCTLRSQAEHQAPVRGAGRSSPPWRDRTGPA